jgi:hypothetical protein
MLALHDLLKTPLYEIFGITIHPRTRRKTPFFDTFNPLRQVEKWGFSSSDIGFVMFTLSMQTNTNVSSDINDDESCDLNNKDRFEEEQEDILTNTMVQNILSSEQIYDYFENAVIVALGQDFKPLGLFQYPIVIN